MGSVITPDRRSAAADRLDLSSVLVPGPGCGQPEASPSHGAQRVIVGPRASGFPSCGGSTARPLDGHSPAASLSARGPRGPGAESESADESRSRSQAYVNSSEALEVACRNTMTQTVICGSICKSLTRIKNGGGLRLLSTTNSEFSCFIRKSVYIDSTSEVWAFLHTYRQKLTSSLPGHQVSLRFLSIPQ